MRTEPSLDPRRDRVTELRETGGTRVVRHRLQRVDERLADERRRLLARIPDAEVDQLPAFRRGPRDPSIELLERVGRDAPHPG